MFIFVSSVYNTFFTFIAMLFCSLRVFCLSNSLNNRFWVDKRPFEPHWSNSFFKSWELYWLLSRRIKFSCPSWSCFPSISFPLNNQVFIFSNSFHFWYLSSFLTTFMPFSNYLCNKYCISCPKTILFLRLVFFE